MKSKTMIAIAAASTFGWAAAAHAGTGQHASWVAAGDEQYPPMMMFDGQSTPGIASRSMQTDESMGSTSATTMGLVGGSFPRDDALGSAPRSSGADSEMSGLDTPDARAADSGVYSEYYVVTWMPASGSDQHVHTIALAPESEALLSLNDDDLIASNYDVILLPADVLPSESNANLFYER
jgi:hypothetical protein